MLQQVFRDGRAHAAFALALALPLALPACALSGVDDAPEESIDATSSAFDPRDDDGVGPLDYPVPSLDVPLSRQGWALPLRIDEEAWRRDHGGCVLRYVKIYDPGRGEAIEVPITVCR